LTRLVDFVTSFESPQQQPASRFGPFLPQCIDQAYATLVAKNGGKCPRSGKVLKDLMTHFTIGGDETCLLASDESVKIIGDAEKRKHEINTVSSRTSITIYRTGSVAGATGPTAFLPPGLRRRPG